MANPQKENGSTSISNELLEQIYSGYFSASQLKIILLVCRYTYGFNRKSARLSNQFIANGTGLHEVTVSKEMSALQNGNVLKVFENPKSRSARLVGLNKDYNSWNGKFSLANSLTSDGVSLAKRLVSPRVSDLERTFSQTANPELAKRLTEFSQTANQEIQHKKYNFTNTTQEIQRNRPFGQKNVENRGNAGSVQLNEAGFPIIDFGLSKSKEDF